MLLLSSVDSFNWQTVKRKRIAMWCPEILAISLILIVKTNGRVYYLQNVDKSPYDDDAKYLSLAKESSRDLDLSFSAGDSDDVGNALHPIKKVYTRVTPERSIANSETSEREPVTYYKLSGTPVAAESEDIIVLPEKHRKLVKIDGNNKGEIILELRVIANHDAT